MNNNNKNDEININNNTLKKKDIFEIVCKLIEIFIIGFFGIYLSYNASEIEKNAADFANEIADYANELTKLSLYPYFTISSDETEKTYTIDNNGGYIQNVTISSSRILCLEDTTNSDNKAYVPCRSTEKSYYDIKDNSFTFSIPRTFYNIEDLAVLFREHFSKKNLSIKIQYFDCLYISYLDKDHNAKIDKYLIGYHTTETENKYFLTPINESLENSLISNTPYTLQLSFSFFSTGTLHSTEIIAKLEPIELQTAQRIFTDNIEQIEKILFD